MIVLLVAVGVDMAVTQSVWPSRTPLKTRGESTETLIFVQSQRAKQ